MSLAPLLQRPDEAHAELPAPAEEAVAPGPGAPLAILSQAKAGGRSPWSGMFEPSGEVGLLPPPLAVKRGLDAYEVVPDDHKGDLGLRQIRKHDHDELQRNGFAALRVVDWPRPGKNDELSQEEFDRLAQAWLGMARGKGMKLKGGERDVSEFKQMMFDTLRDSPTMRGLLTEIGSETDDALGFDVNLGRNQEKVLVDSFASKSVDLADLEMLPSSHRRAPLPKDMLTRNEEIVHFLKERRVAAKIQAARRTAKQPAASTRALFDMSHPHAMNAQNAYRAERGQAPITGAIAHPVANDPDRAVAKYHIQGGKVVNIRMHDGGVIDEVSDPVPDR